MKTTLSYGIVGSSKTRVRCLFCGVHIPKATKCIEQHTNGAKHKETIELMNENGICFTNESLHCKPCNRVLLEDEFVMDHIEGDDHANWMATIEDLVDGEFISLEDYLSAETDDVYCEVCNCSINVTLPLIEAHVNSINHRTNIIERLKPLNGLFHTNGDQIWCKICNKYIVNEVQDILAHLDDDVHHMEWFMEIEDLIDSHEVSIQEFLTNEQEAHAYCNKCNVEVLCDAQSIENHVNSESHLNRFGL